MRVTPPPGQNDVAPLAVTPGFASGAFSVTTTAADRVEQPFAFVTVTSNVPLALTVIDGPDWPFDQ